MAANVRTRRECVSVRLGGPVPTARLFVPTDSMDRTVVKSVAARMMPNVARMMVNASVSLAGWEIGATRCVRKDSTEITAWTRATALPVISFVTRLSDACAVTDTPEKSATYRLLKQRSTGKMKHRTPAWLGGWYWPSCLSELSSPWYCTTGDGWPILKLK
uniref:(northern house mosquito) hypothetical protein n=1 Tax=Culex pipiens TaxID=7175 RepID=A0A8D8P3Q9_CULPI